ncbi:suppressor of fused domain protein [Actinomadura sp. LOL_016]|uniref:suppressor of fused domain protein n=1 Tax=unclassified Actinomadura TaxID=2626254 RepID=UPI003A7F9A14
MLQNLARYVFNSGNWFEPGHHMNVNGPIATDRDDSDIRAIAVLLDPELGEIGTPHGSLQFLQVVGLASAEYEAVRQWNSDAFAIDEPAEGRLELGVPLAALDDLLATLRPTAARRPVPALPGLTVEIVPTVMKDQYGEETGEVIG